MPSFGLKEEPNTRNVVVWPQGALNDDGKKTYKTTRKNLPRKLKMWEDFGWIGFSSENMEYYYFFLGGSLLWIFIAHFVLKFLQFPFHKHIVETFGIYLLPITLLYFILVIIDWLFTDTKKES